MRAEFARVRPDIHANTLTSEVEVSGAWRYCGSRFTRFTGWVLGSTLSGRATCSAELMKCPSMGVEAGPESDRAQGQLSIAFEWGIRGLYGMYGQQELRMTHRSLIRIVAASRNEPRATQRAPVRFVCP